MKLCRHNKLEVIWDIENDLENIRCIQCHDCGEHWVYNSILKAYSNTFVGIFKKKKSLGDKNGKD